MLSLAGFKSPPQYWCPPQKARSLHCSPRFGILSLPGSGSPKLKNLWADWLQRIKKLLTFMVWLNHPPHPLEPLVIIINQPLVSPVRTTTESTVPQVVPILLCLCLIMLIIILTFRSCFLNYGSYYTTP